MALEFDPAKFMANPSEEALQYLKKDDLISLAKHLELAVKKAWRKQEIRNVIVKHLVSLKLFEESALSDFVEMPDSETRKLELELEFRKLEMLEKEKEREMLEREKEREMLEKEKEREMLEKEKEREMLEREREKEREVELAKQKLDYELEMKRLELGGKIGLGQPQTSSSHFDITKYIKLVPPFPGN